MLELLTLQSLIISSTAFAICLYLTKIFVTIPHWSIAALNAQSISRILVTALAPSFITRLLMLMLLSAMIAMAAR
jgi:hypothetical protein